MIADHDIKELIDKKKFEQFLKYRIRKSIDKNMDLLWCPTADCKYAFAKDGEVRDFRCPICTTEYCIPCKSEAHVDLTCEEYKASKDGANLMLDFCEKNQFQKCPHCG